MKKTDLLIGIVLGVLTAMLGSYIFVIAFIDTNFQTGLQKIAATDSVGKIITLGAVLNIILFFTLLHFRKELMARGVILATILLAIATLFA